MKNIKYQYAKNENGDIIDIENVTKEYRKYHKFFCISCGDEMVAKIGEIKAKHFAHKTETSNCSPETYLHKLAKNVLKERFYSDKPFEITYCQDIMCSDKDSCKFYIGSDCKEMIQKTFDIKQYYDTCQEEMKVGSFIADLKLTSSEYPNRPPIMIEIYVTHKCTVEKRESGIRIIEIHIENEYDIRNLKSDIIKEDNDKCIFYGFNRDSKITKSLECKNVSKFYLYNSGSAYVERGTCRECFCKSNPKSILELNINNSTFNDPYEIGYVESLNLGYNVKTCNICKYHRTCQDTLYSDYMHLCCLYKNYGTPQNPNPKYAKNCKYYKINNSLIDEIKQLIEKKSIRVEK